MPTDKPTISNNHYFDSRDSVVGGSKHNVVSCSVDKCRYCTGIISCTNSATKYLIKLLTDAFWASY